MDVSSTSALRPLTQSSPRQEEGTELELSSFAQFLGGPDHNMWFGDVITQQQAARQNSASDADPSSEPMTSVERAVRRDDDRDDAADRNEPDVDEIQASPDDDKDLPRVEEKVESEQPKENDDDNFAKMEKVVASDVEDENGQDENGQDENGQDENGQDETGEGEVLDDLAGAMLNTGETDAVKTSRFAIHQEQAVRANKEETGPKLKSKADVFAKFEGATETGTKSEQMTTAKPVIEAKAPLTMKTPSRVGDFVATDGEVQAAPKQVSAAALSQAKTAENTDADGEWLQMLQRNLPVDQVASRAQTIRTADTVQLGSNRVSAIAGPGLRVQGVDRPTPTAAAQRATPLHRPQLPEGVDEMTLMRQISDGLKIKPGQNQTAEIRLRPADLGRVLIQLKMSGDEAKVVVTTESAAVGDALSNGLDQLRRDIMAQGVQVTQLEVRQEGDENPNQQDQEQLLDDDGEEREGHPSADDGRSPGRRKAKGRISVQA